MCTSGFTKQVNGHCCEEIESHDWAELAEIPVYLIGCVYILYSHASVKASGGINSQSLVFFLQMMQLIGKENDWRFGIPFVEESVDFMGEVLSFNFHSVTGSACEPVRCRLLSFGTIEAL